MDKEDNDGGDMFYVLLLLQLLLLLIVFRKILQGLQCKYVDNVEHRVHGKIILSE